MEELPNVDPMALPEPITLLGVVGDPVIELPLDLVFNELFAEKQQPYHFVKIHLRDVEKLGDVIKGASAMGFASLGITVPYKSAVLPYLDEIDESAAGVGASNVVVFRDDGRAVGLQTDGDAIEAPMSANMDLAGRHVVVLGAGGAARGVVSRLARVGLRQLTVAARRAEQGQPVVDMIADLGPADLVSSYLPWQGRLDIPIDTDVVVNATSAGAAPALVELDLNWDAMAQVALAVDLVTRPRATPFLQRAHGLGIQTVDGIDMIVGIVSGFCEDLPMDVTRDEIDAIATRISGKPIRDRPLPLSES